MRTYSMAYLTGHTLTPPDMVRLAAELGYNAVGMRLSPNGPGAIHQTLLGQPEVLRETQAALRDTGVRVFDLEIIRIGEGFDAATHQPLIDAGAALGARCFLVACDDTDPQRLADGYAALCERIAAQGMFADLEFMPFSAVKSARDALHIVDLAGRPKGAGILVDALHVDRSTTTLADLRALPRELLHYWQICDAVTEAQHGRPFTHDEMVHTARQERLLPGEGGIDLQGIADVMPAELPVSVEVPHHVRLPQLGQKEWARQALASTRALLEPALNA